MDHPFKIRSHSTFSVTRYPFIPDYSQTEDNWNPSDQLHPDRPKSPKNDCLTRQIYFGSPAEKCQPDLSGGGDGDLGESSEIDCKTERHTRESEVRSPNDTEAKESDDTREENVTTASSKLTSDFPATQTSTSAPEEPTTPYDSGPTQPSIFFKGKKIKAVNGGVPGRKLNYGEMEAKLQEFIMGKFGRRKKSELEALGIKTPDSFAADSEPKRLGSAISSVAPSGTTTFHTSDWPFVSTVPQKKPLKPVLANYHKIHLFQGPFRRLPTPWLRRPETPLQRIYGSVVKQMPLETERERRKVVEQGVINGHMYRRIKKAKSEYDRDEQLRSFKKHEAFIRYKGPVANLEIKTKGKIGFRTRSCHCFKTGAQDEESVTIEASLDSCDLNSTYDDESPIMTANQ